MSRKTLRQASVLAVAAAALFATPGLAFAATPGVAPQNVDLTLKPGESSTVTKTVTTPVVLPKPDIYFLSDVTGSMGGTIDNVKANAGSILTAVKDAAGDAQFGVGHYRDFPYDSPVYATDQTVTNDVTAVTGAIGSWAADGGGDTPEANLYALHKVAADAGFRSGSSKIVVWFGDAPGHDPICSAISGESADVTEGSVTAELKAAGIKVIAVSVTSGALGLDGDPAPESSDYGVCGTPGGTAGQATRITEATGGAFFDDVDPSEVSAKILEGLKALDSTITVDAACDPGLSLGFDPSLPQTVASGGSVTLQETVKLAAGATSGAKKCTTRFLVNGVDAGPAFTQTVNVKVVQYHNTNANVKITGGESVALNSCIADAKDGVIQKQTVACNQIATSGNLVQLEDVSIWVTSATAPSSLLYSKNHANVWLSGGLAASINLCIADAKDGVIQKQKVACTQSATAGNLLNLSRVSVGIE